MRADRPLVHMLQADRNGVWHFATESYTNGDTKLIHYGDCQTAFFDWIECRSFILGAKLPDPICKACLNVRRGLRTDGSKGWRR